jgi:hypothetical protein
LTLSRVIRLFTSFSSKRSSSLIISAPSEHGLSLGQSWCASGNAIQTHESLHVRILRANNAIYCKFVVALHPKACPAKRKVVEHHTECPDVDGFCDSLPCEKGRHAGHLAKFCSESSKTPRVGRCHFTTPLSACPYQILRLHTTEGAPNTTACIIDACDGPDSDVT